LERRGQPEDQERGKKDYYDEEVLKIGGAKGEEAETVTEGGGGFGKGRRRGQLSATDYLADRGQRKKKGPKGAIKAQKAEKVKTLASRRRKEGGNYVICIKEKSWRKGMWAESWKGVLR